MSPKALENVVWELSLVLGIYLEIVGWILQAPWLFGCGRQSALDERRRSRAGFSGYSADRGLKRIPLGRGSQLPAALQGGFEGRQRLDSRL